jgi:hypothetical protein
MMEESCEWRLTPGIRASPYARCHSAGDGAAAVALAIGTALCVLLRCGLTVTAVLCVGPRVFVRLLSSATILPSTIKRAPGASIARNHAGYRTHRNLLHPRSRLLRAKAI